MDVSTTHRLPALAFAGILLCASLGVLVTVAQPVAAQTPPESDFENAGFVDINRDGLVDGAVIKMKYPVLTSTVRAGDFQFMSSFSSFGGSTDREFHFNRYGSGHFEFSTLPLDVQDILRTQGFCDPAADAWVPLTPTDAGPRVPDRAAGTFARCFGIHFEQDPFWTSGGTLPESTDVIRWPTILYKGGLLELRDHVSTATSHRAQVLPVTSTLADPNRNPLDLAPPVLLGITVPMDANGQPAGNLATAIFSERLAFSTLPQSDDAFDASGPPGVAGPTPTADVIQSVSPLESGASEYRTKAVRVHLDRAPTLAELGTEGLAPRPTFLQDMSGNPAAADPMPFDVPRIVSVLGNMGSDRAYVTFNMPVQGPAGALRPGDFLPPERGPSGQVTGITNTRHYYGAATVELILNAALNGGDVSPSTPTKIQVRAERVAALGGTRFQEAGTPTQAAISNRFPSEPLGYEFRRHVAPTFTSAEAHDLDNNGFLDAIKVTLSEGLNDGPGGSNSNLVDAQWNIIVDERDRPRTFTPGDLGQNVEGTRYARGFFGAYGDGDCFTDNDGDGRADSPPCVWSPDLLGPEQNFQVASRGPVATAGACSTSASLGGESNDNGLWLCWQQGDFDARNGTCTGWCIGTGAHLSFDYHPLQSAADRLRDPEGNRVAPHTGFVAQDKAAPRLLLAETLDICQGQPGTPPVWQPYCDDDLKRGYIDTYFLVFSEPMDPREDPLKPDCKRSTHEGWSVEGREFERDAMHLGIEHGSCDVFTSVAFLRFSEVSDDPEDDTYGPPDTAATPQLTYRPTAPGWRDMSAGNLPTISSASITELDGARPVLLRIDGKVGQRSLDLVFSEPVMTANGTAVQASNTLRYLNYGFGQVSGPLVDGLEHTVGADRMTWLLNGVIASADLGPSGDRVSLVEAVPTASALTSVEPGCRHDGGLACSRIFESSPAAPLKKAVLAAPFEQGPPFEFATSFAPEIADDDTAPSAPTHLRLAAGVTPNPTHDTVVVTFPRSFDENKVFYDLYFQESELFPGSIRAGTKAIRGTQETVGETVTATFTGLKPDSRLYLGVLAIDEAGNQNPLGAILTNETTPTEAATIVTPPAPFVAGNDTVPPTVAALEAGTATANSFSVTFIQPTDNSGSIAGYQIKVGTTAFTTMATFDRTKPQELPTDMTAQVQPGSRVTITFRGALPETDYWVAVKAYDAAGLAAPRSNVLQVTTTADVEPPGPPLEVEVIPASGIREGDPVRVTWRAAVDPDSVIDSYIWTINDDAEFVIDSEDDGTVTDATRADPVNFAAGTNYFHVAAQSLGRIGPTETVAVEVGNAAPQLTPEQIRTANQGFEERVRKSGSDVVVSWTAPADPPAPLAGVQVWCVEDGASRLLATHRAGSGPFTGREHRDVGGSCGGSYMVTGFYDGDVGYAADGTQVGTYADPDADSKALESSGFDIPTWLLFVLGGVLLLVIVLVLVFVLRSRGAKQESTWQDADDDAGMASTEEGWVDESTATTPTTGEATEPAWAEEEGTDVPGHDGSGADEPAWAEEGGADGPAWAEDPEAEAPDESGMAGAATAAAAGSVATPFDEAADDAEAHQVTCPECNEVFIAEGRRPMRIECPNCGVQGTLN